MLSYGLHVGDRLAHRSTVWWGGDPAVWTFEKLKGRSMAVRAYVGASLASEIPLRFLKGLREMSMAMWLDYGRLLCVI